MLEVIQKILMGIADGLGFRLSFTLNPHADDPKTPYTSRLKIACLSSSDCSFDGITQRTRDDYKIGDIQVSLPAWHSHETVKVNCPVCGSPITLKIADMRVLHIYFTIMTALVITIASFLIAVFLSTTAERLLIIPFSVTSLLFLSLFMRNQVRCTPDNIRCHISEYPQDNRHMIR